MIGSVNMQQNSQLSFGKKRKGLGKKVAEYTIIGMIGGASLLSSKAVLAQTTPSIYKNRFMHHQEMRLEKKRLKQELERLKKERIPFDSIKKLQWDKDIELMKKKSIEMFRELGIILFEKGYLKKEQLLEPPKENKLKLDNDSIPFDYVLPEIKNPPLI